MFELLLNRIQLTKFFIFISLHASEIDLKSLQCPFYIFLGEKRRVPIEHVRITNQIKGQRNRLKSNLKFTGHFLGLFTCHMVKSHELYFLYLDYFLL